MMIKSEKPLVYVILGTVGSGRREIVNDLVEGGLPDNARAAIFVSESETDPLSLPNTTIPVGVVRWKMEGAEIVSGSIPEGVTHLFFITDGRTNPVDQIEALSPWLTINDIELSRIVTVVNCQLVEKNPQLLAWYEACIHFSDVVLLNRREGVENKWMSTFQRHFDDLYYPCLFELVKGGRVKNPVLILEPEARRMTQVFDERDPILADIEIGIEDEEGEEEELSEEEIAERKFEELTPPEEDPYLHRRIGGRRSKEIPDISKFLT